MNGVVVEKSVMLIIAPKISRIFSLSLATGVPLKYQKY
jgi:hypothetical protein